MSSCVPYDGVMSLSPCMGREGRIGNSSNSDPYICNLLLLFRGLKIYRILLQKDD